MSAALAPRYLLDTNICIYIRQQRPAEVLARFERLRPGAAAISVITSGELLFGAQRSPQRALALSLLEELSSALPTLPMPAHAAEHYGDIRAELANKGQMIGGNDLWIAAHARASGLILVTNNVGEFQRVPGLKVQNWVKRQKAGSRG